MPPSTPGPAALTSNRWKHRKSRGAALFAGDETPYSPLQKLENAGQEVDEITKHLPGAVAVKGRGSDEAAVAASCGDLDVLHLSCHGEFDDDDPLLSRVYLADGSVYGYEIVHLQCRPRLAVLSACETALQRRAAGDETFGLVRAFLARGAETVVASLWTRRRRVSLANIRWRVLPGACGNHFDVPNALKYAQKQIMSISAYAHPFFWAPFVAIGGSEIQPNLGLNEEK